MHMGKDYSVPTKRKSSARAISREKGGKKGLPRKKGTTNKDNTE